MQELFNNIKKFKNKVALHDSNSKKVSYSELCNLKKKFIKIFPKSSVILFLIKNTNDSISSYISLFDIKVIKIILDDAINYEYFLNLRIKYKPNFIICSEKKMNQLKIKNYNFLNGDYCFFKINDKIKKINEINSVLLTTSGTTSSPKFVRLSNKNIIDNTRKIISYLKIKKNSKCITVFSPAYSYGMSILNTHIVSGGTVYVNEKKITDIKFWNLFKKNKIESFNAIPLMIKFLNKLDFNLLNLKFLKYITIAGGKIDNEYLLKLSNSLIKKNVSIFNMYGQTEAAPRMSYLNPKFLISKIGSIGKPLKGGKFYLINRNNKIVKESFKKGELVYKGKNVCLGYANSFKDLKLGDKNKSLLRTGDIAIKDKQNYYFIVGRKKNISKINGVRVDLDELKNMKKIKKFINKIFSDDKFIFVDLIDKRRISYVKNFISNKLGISNKYIIHYKTNYKTAFKQI